jgi:Flp pilus assembly protein CpaB
MQERLARIFKNRGGAVAVGAIVAVVALILLVVYLHSYRSSVNSGKQPERVLVATKLIQRGTSGTLVAQQGMYQVATVQKDQLKLNALTDPSSLNDRLAANDIFPGQQLTQDDFTTEQSTAIPYQIAGRQRAISVPVDATHGMIGQVAAGDYVDVYVGVTDGGQVSAKGALVTLLAPDIYVLAAPGTDSANAVLRINTQDAAKFAYAADNARIWLVLRPQVNASRTPPKTATLASLLAGVK